MNRVSEILVLVLERVGEVAEKRRENNSLETHCQVQDFDGVAH